MSSRSWLTWLIDNKNFQFLKDINKKYLLFLKDVYRYIKVSSLIKNCLTAPRMINCPGKYSRVMVEVQRDSNVALMYHQFRARDYLGEELQVHVSQQKFYACNCSLGTRVRANATAVDRLGGKTTCCYTVEIVGEEPFYFF